MRDFLHHLFLPRESNNHRPRILHHTGLILLIAFFFALEFGFSTVHERRGDILGVKADISIIELLTQMNKQRIDAGLAPLSLNNELSNAASQKATDMFAKNYWAHNGPDGTTPWVFIKSSGYDYLYAGENLARGFSNSQDIIKAWMDSPGHRENMLSPNYQDVGFAIVPGQLTGDETVLVVEMFGKKRGIPAEIASSDVNGPSLTVPEEVPAAVVPEENSLPNPSPAIASFQSQPLLNIGPVTKGISLIVLSVFLLTLFADLIIIERKKIFRIVAHNVDTMLFLLTIFLTVLIVGNGLVL